MNAKTAKLINKHTTWCFGSSKVAKRWWNRLPWTQRNKHRLRMLRNLMNATN